MSRHLIDRWNSNHSPTQVLRHNSTASTNSSDYSHHTFSSHAPSRASASSSPASTIRSSGRKVSGQKRGISDTVDMYHSEPGSIEGSPDHVYRNVRQSLRPLPQASTSSPPSVGRRAPSHLRTQSQDPYQHSENTGPLNASSMVKHNPASPKVLCQQREGNGSQSPSFMAPNLQELKKSSTSYLRTLSKFAQSTEVEDLALTKPSAPVMGLQHRRQLKRIDSATGGGNGTTSRSFAFERNWMDKQRQFLQAYEYLCHIGEAKEWIEDITHQQIPPIVELESALRNGVTLAEIVQAFHPEKTLKIFRHEKLQYKHSDNIVLFFRFLEEVELPELFRFELIDLYEKKNIPKVIYCIHALSWLLYRKGMVDFRIGNLVGHLHFEHHELEQTQKGLDKAGISMPSFQGMGASFGAEPESEPEPVESEEDKIERQLRENEVFISDFQNQIRGAMVRLRLGDTMNALWNSEDTITELQSLIRGDWARQIIHYRLNMKSFATKLQAISRGFLVRRTQAIQEQRRHANQPQIMKLQSLIRARKARSETDFIKSQIKEHNVGVKLLQAAIRGSLTRQGAKSQARMVEKSGTNVNLLQAAIRGMASRRALERQQVSLYAQEPLISRLQAGIRGLLSRSRQEQMTTYLHSNTSKWTLLQAAARSALVRNNVSALRNELCSYSSEIKALQAQIRGQALRRGFHTMLRELSVCHAPITSLQSSLRGFLARRRVSQQRIKLEACSKTVIQFQAISRGAISRADIATMLTAIEDTEHDVLQLQSLIRAMLCRNKVADTLNQLDEHDDSIVLMQAAINGARIRADYAEKKRFFKENMEKVIKIQSVVRAKIQGQAYKSLTSGKNPPVGTLKGFVHLLNDSDFDFNEEIEFERLRKKVVQHVRQNESADQYIQQLDIKIALLVKNKITLDEVIKHQRHFGGFAAHQDFGSKDPFDLKALNKNSRTKLEHYQELFFLLQTQPHYLSSVFRNMREQGVSEKECERIKHLVMGLFGYAQKRREEYYLVKLITRSFREEMGGSTTLQDYLRTVLFCHKLFSVYMKSSKDRKFFRDILGIVVKENIVDNPRLDLESDPMQIYLSAIKNEELRTGQRSRRNPDVPREEAIRDHETRTTFIAHMQDLRDIADQFFTHFEDCLNRMPFGVRYIAQQMHESLVARFPGEDATYILQLVGHWIWRNYLQIAVLDPEKFGVTDRSMTQEQKRNLGEVAKVLNQAASGREFGGDNIYLQPLNNYIKESIQRFGNIWSHVINIPSAEEYYDIDEFNDLYAKTKPTLFIKMADIFSIHQLVSSNIDTICPSRDDVLRGTLRELGNVKSNETEFMNVSTGEITLTLTPKYLDNQDPDADVKALFTETKRCILYIIRVQSGANLLEILVKPITPEDGDKWETLAREELITNDGRRAAYVEANNILDISSLSYPDLKRIALENVLHLESIGRLTRSNNYQDLLNSIAVDIRNKHRRRLQRQRELEGVKTTLARLDEQAVYLAQQLKTYNDYIEQAMVTLQNKKGKKRFLLPFTKQYNHERELQRSGRSFKFGSYKYSARTLADKGVLIHWRGYLEHQWHRVDLTISSNEVGVFTIDGSTGNMMVPGASAQIPLDDLLQAQFNNTQCMEFFEGRVLKVNVNLFLHLIMKKFYND